MPPFEKSSRTCRDADVHRVTLGLLNLCEHANPLSSVSLSLSLSLPPSLSPSVPLSLPPSFPLPLPLSLFLRYVYAQSNCVRCGTRVQSWDVNTRNCFACPSCQPPPQAQAALNDKAKDSSSKADIMPSQMLVANLRSTLKAMGADTTVSKATPPFFPVPCPFSTFQPPPLPPLT